MRNSQQARASELRQGAAAAPQAPAASAPPTSPGPGPAPTLGPSLPSGPACNVDGLGYQQLKATQAELMRQRQTLADRRSGAASAYESATGTAKSSMADRIVVLDQSIIKMEGQIACLAQGMAVKAPVNDPGIRINTGWDGGSVSGLGFTVFFGTIFVTSMFWRRIMRRRNRMDGGEQIAPQATQRLDRIEQAVDTIAVEIERISENQRFMTRLMTETQLAGTIAAVRSSTDAAKNEVG